MNMACKSRFVKCLVVDLLAYPPCLCTQAYQCDVSDAEQTAETFSLIDKDLGPVTGLIAVSGSFFGPVISSKRLAWYRRMLVSPW